MIDDFLIGKDLEGGCSGVIKILPRHFFFSPGEMDRSQRKSQSAGVTTHIHIVPTLRMRGDIALLHLFQFYWRQMY
jgi:hypothetical protein